MQLRSIATAAVAVSLLAGCDPTGDDVVGPEGGVVVSRDGRLTLDIPAGALTDDVEITIEPADDLPEGALGPAYRVLPVGTVFEAPVAVMYDYGAMGMEVDVRDIELVAHGASEWSRLADRSLWEDEEIVSATALYLSTFCVVLRDQ
ncbi:MAG: hypothetical protein H6712_02090 [Myxococcales bacterium]|nr:hypothetical protein [Myxococcales bacterium]MCB9712617.1 hypothetical protein [Myxococcales bacterium]